MTTERNREQTMAKILGAARAEFARQGFAGGRVERIAKAACVNKALVFYYFKSKSNLYAELVDRLFLDLESRLFPALERVTRDDVPAALVGPYFDVFTDHPDTIRLFVREVTDGGGAILERMRRPDRIPYFGRLAGEIGRIRGEGREAAGTFILTAMSLILYTFIARDLFGKMFPGVSGGDFHENRKQEILRVLAAAYPAGGGAREDTRE